MSLIKYHECGRQISDQARTCPQCGAPVIAIIKRRQEVDLIGLGIRLAFVAVICVVLWFLVPHLGHPAFSPLKVKPRQQQAPPH